MNDQSEIAILKAMSARRIRINDDGTEEEVKLEDLPPKELYGIYGETLEEIGQQFNMQTHPTFQDSSGARGPFETEEEAEEMLTAGANTYHDEHGWWAIYTFSTTTLRPL